MYRYSGFLSMDFRIPPVAGKNRLRKWSGSALERSMEIPSSSSQLYSSSKVMVQSTLSPLQYWSTSSFLEIQGLTNTTKASGSCSFTSFAWACMGEITGARQGMQEG